MIEGNIANTIELGESMQLLDVYNKKKIIKVFNVFKMIILNKFDNKVFYIVLKFLFFFQVMTYSLVTSPHELEDDDMLIQIIKSIREILLPHLLIRNDTHYFLALTMIYSLALIIIISIIYLYLYSNSQKNNNKPYIFVIVLNCIQILYFYYLQLPIINILFYSILCNDRASNYLKALKCNSNNYNFLLIILSVISFILLLVYSISLSIFNYDIGMIDEKDSLSRVNCNFEFYENFGMIFFYSFGFFLKLYLPKEQISRIIFKSFNVIISTALFIYGHKYLFYYNNILNLITIIGWIFIQWFNLMIILKDIFKITNSILLVVIGWLLLGIIYYLIDNRRSENTWTGSKFFETQNIKDIEILIFFLLKLTRNLNNSSVIEKGIINVFEQNFSDDPELNEISQKFLSNSNLQKQFGGIDNFQFHLLNIIILIYNFFLEKPLLRNNIMLILCYFIINKLNNLTYAVYLCSQIKVSGMKMMYLKYLLMEKIKIHQLNRLIPGMNKDSISKIEIGSAIIYYRYINNLKIKIYDAVSAQIEYFETLKNNQNSNLNTRNFLNAGEKILTLRNDILLLWEKIMNLNPFCEESKQDYLLYLSKIIQDQDMANKEEEKYNNFKKEKLVHKNNFYFSLFNSNVLSIILVDGYQLRGKLLYSTPNFGILFNFTPKELLNSYIYNFQPSVIANFHKKLVDETIKYSNLNIVFKDKKRMLMKGKNGGIYTILTYIKTIPNLSYGLMYIMTIERIPDKTFIIILDQNYKINEMSDEISINVGNETNISPNFNLSNTLINHHIGIILPEILKELKYKNDKFVFCKKDIELKGKLYPNSSNFEEGENYIDIILEKIKKTGKLITEAEEIEIKNQEMSKRLSSTSMIPLKKKKNNICINNQEYKEYINKLNEKFKEKETQIFYLLNERNFLNERFRYFKLSISKDMFITNDNIHSHHNKLNALATTIIGNELDILGVKEKINGIRMKVISDEKTNQILNKDIENNNKAQKNYELTYNSLESSTSVSQDSIINNLKIKIFNQSETLIIIYLKIILLIVTGFSIALIIIDCIGLNKKFENLNQFLEQNLFFNQTKLSSCCYYIASSDIKNYLLGTLWFCDTWDCKNNYINYIYYCHEHMKNFIDTDIYYNDEFKVTLQKRFNKTLSAYKIEKQYITSMNTYNILNTLVSSSLFIHYNLGQNDYILRNETLSLVENIVNLSYEYLKNTEIKGYNIIERRKKSEKSKYKGSKIYLIINIIIFVISTFLILFYIIKIFKYEKYFLGKLIKFQSSKFEEYNKYLQDLKKKLRNDTSEEEDQNQDDSLKNSNNDEDESENTKKVRKKSYEKLKKNEIENDKKKSKRKKISKSQQEKNDKIEIMSSYFFKFNLILAIEIIFILVLYLSYYIFIQQIYIGKKKNFLEFDDLENTLLGIFLRINQIYTEFQYVIVNYLYFKRIKNLIKEDLENGKTEIYVNGYIFSSLEDLNNYNYDIKIPDISFNKIGTLLVPLIADISIDNTDIKTQSSVKQLKELYNGNVCNVLYDKSNTLYSECSTFWSSILIQGLENTIIEYGLKIAELQNYFIDWNNGLLTGELVYESDLFFDFEYFIIYFFSDAFYKTIELMSDLRIQKINSIKKLFELTLILYLALIFLLYMLLIFLVHKMKINFNKFLNFVAIIPIQYLRDDDDFFNDVLRLDKNIY